MAATGVKICGLSDPQNLATAIEAGARFVGFVFYPPSPRNVSFDIAFNLARAVPTSVRSVGLFVDPTDDELALIASGIQLDMIQLHGNESPGRVAQIKERYPLQIMKAIRVGTAEDLQNLAGYEAAADWLLFDSKSESRNLETSHAREHENTRTRETEHLPGGTGKRFDWNLLKGRKFAKPWMLSGGLTPENVKDALSQLSPTAVDVSSGVESAPGQKDPAKIKAFIEAVKTAI